MGMHFGVVAACCPWESMRAQLHELGIEDVGASADGPIDDSAWFGCEHRERSYVFDPELLLSTDGDAVVALSARLHALVVGFGGETVSGTFWLFAADDGRLLRAHWHCLQELRAPFDEGSWPGGSPIDLHDIDGEGLFALVGRGGFDFKALFETGARRLLNVSDAFSLPRGEVAERIDQHRVANLVPKHEQPGLGLLIRSTVDPSTRPSGSAPPQGFWVRVRGWFGR